MAKESQARGGKPDMTRPDMSMTGQNQMRRRGFCGAVVVVVADDGVEVNGGDDDVNMKGAEDSAWQWPLFSESQMFHQMVMRLRIRRTALWMCHEMDAARAVLESRASPDAATVVSPVSNGLRSPSSSSASPALLFIHPAKTPVTNPSVQSIASHNNPARR